ncbi:MAG: ATP-binding cassette domain-containing protein [Saprospiraceae bacterium]|nr:ATP-binding cassette domain-containing protein [Saprospiraceae bacterium]
MEYVAQLKNANIYHGNTRVLTEVNLSISKAEFVYLIGKTGDGKSSLLKTLWGELPLKEGQGKVTGVELVNISTAQLPLLRRKIGMVFQDFNLFQNWTVDENLRFVLEATGHKDKKAIDQRIEEVLARVNLSHKVKEKAFKISGGEQQRVVIARAILNQPLIILADEPTGNLDPENTDAILHLLRDLAIEDQSAILMATHDYAIFERFPGRIYQCAEGQVREIE